MPRQQVVMPQKEPGIEQSLIPMAGGLVGSYFGGPAGGAVGGKVGQEAVKGNSQPGAVQSTALDRKMNSMSQDPGTQLAQGQEAAKRLGVEGEFGDTLLAAMERDRQEKLRQQSMQTGSV